MKITQWKGIYIALLAINLLYIAIFIWIMKTFS